MVYTKLVTLGIETSCDETACGIVENGTILSNVVTSSVHLHERFGGVIPEIASRFHVEYINYVIKRALQKAKKSLKDIHIIAVTSKPGLPGSLLVGMAFARALSYSLRLPLIEVDHLIAHIYVNLLTYKNGVKFPFVGVVISGGHTNIFICNSISDFKLIGKTRDDAVGEAFDKVAKMLNIGYPGGPKIEKMAKGFNGKPIPFPRVFLEEDSFDFSLSGIKTAVYYYIKNRKVRRAGISQICWSFQEAVFDVLVEKIIKACKKYRINRIVLGGGVISNSRLREKLKLKSKIFGYEIFYPDINLCLDNGVMVAGLGEAIFLNQK